MILHPLYLTSYWWYFCHLIHCIDDITRTIFMRSQPLYMSTSYPLYTTTYSLYFFHHRHCICVLHPPFPWYHTLFIFDIAPTIYLTSDTLYKVSHPQFMTSRHIIYDITCTVFMSSVPRYLTLHPQYLCLHTPLSMISEQLYVWHHTHFIYDILCTIHNVTSTLWVHPMVVTTLYPLHSWHPKHYIQHHTHDHTKNLSAISHYISDTTFSVACHQTQCINCVTLTLCMTLHTLCMTSHAVCMASHEHFITSHRYSYDITSSISMALYPVYMISLLLVHENITTIPGISPTLFDITATASVWSHPLYQCLHNNYGSFTLGTRMISYTPYIT